MVKLISIGVFSLLLSCTVIAQPPQRIIVSFNAALTVEQQSVTHQQVEKLLTQGYTLSESSNNQRWIIVLSGRLSAEKLRTVMERINDLPNVSHVETDGLMQVH